jgi:hypothetical protein
VLGGIPAFPNVNSFLFAVVLDFVDASTVCNIILLRVGPGKDLVPFLLDPLLYIALKLHTLDVLQVIVVPCLVTWFGISMLYKELADVTVLAHRRGEAVQCKSI